MTNCNIHGNGIEIIDTQYIYEGTFQNGLKSGEGTIRYSNGNEYTGAFQNNMRHGFGNFKWADCGNLYVGNWQHN
jgi:hypothetical protein